MTILIAVIDVANRILVLVMEIKENCETTKTRIYPTGA
jgi:hypothetical protein